MPRNCEEISEPPVCCAAAAGSHNDNTAKLLATLSLSIHPLKLNAKHAIDRERGHAALPQPRTHPAIPEKGEEHRKTQRTQGIEVHRLRPVPFRQCEQSTCEAAQRTRPSGEPIESTEPHAGIAGHAEVPQCGEQRHCRRRAARHRGSHNASAVRGSNPTISLYAM